MENGTDIVTKKVIRGTYNVNGKPTKVLEILGGELSGTKIYLNADTRGIHKHRVYSQDLFIPNHGIVKYTHTYIPPLVVENRYISGTIVYFFGDVLGTYEGIGTANLEYMHGYQIDGYENVTVPFGTFTALKSKESVTIQGTIGNEYLYKTTTTTDWAIPDVGIIKSVTSDGITHELMSFKYDDSKQGAKINPSSLLHLLLE